MSSKKSTLASRAWRDMNALVLSHDRKLAVSEELGLSFARVRALRRLAEQPQTLRALAEQLAADPPYVTLMIDDLEKLGLVKRAPHPTDRRAKLVQLTAAGRTAAARADVILDEPPAALRNLPATELATLARIFEQLQPDGQDGSRA
ncbi:MAG: MarR family transcriptional regulator [Thermoleophilaceae bacterium]|nr:MarR family transcriptional regulator [Thermoleophilaceae bacterium]